MKTFRLFEGCSACEGVWLAGREEGVILMVALQQKEIVQSIALHAQHTHSVLCVRERMSQLFADVDMVYSWCIRITLNASVAPCTQIFLSINICIFFVVCVLFVVPAMRGCELTQNLNGKIFMLADGTQTCRGKGNICM